MTVLERVNLLLSDEKYSKERIGQYIDIVSARLCMRLEESVLPPAFQSVCADAVVKMHRRYCYEGISSENDGGMSVSFADDILAEYESDIQAFKAGSKAVRFI